MGAVKEILEKWGTVRSRRLALGSFRGGHRWRRGGETVSLDSGWTSATRREEGREEGEILIRLRFGR